MEEEKNNTASFLTRVEGLLRHSWFDEGVAVRQPSRVRRRRFPVSGFSTLDRPQTVMLRRRQRNNTNMPKQNKTTMTEQKNFTIYFGHSAINYETNPKIMCNNFLYFIFRINVVH